MHSVEIHLAVGSEQLAWYHAAGVESEMVGYTQDVLIQCLLLYQLVSYNSTNTYVMATYQSLSEEAVFRNPAALALCKRNQQSITKVKR